MKRSIPLLILLLCEFLLSAQSPINLKMGALPTDKSRNFIESILGRVGDDLYVTRVSQYFHEYQYLYTQPNIVGKGFKEKLNIHLCRMDAQLKDLNSLDLGSLFPDEKTWVKSAEILNGEIIVFAEQHDGANKKVHLFIRRIDPKTLKPKAEAMKVASVGRAAFRNYGEFISQSSPNGKYIGFIAREPQVDKSVEVYQAFIYTGSWEKVSEAKFTVKNEKGIEIDRTSIRNDGQFSVNSSGYDAGNLCYFTQVFDASGKPTVSGKYCLPGFHPNFTVTHTDSLDLAHYWTLYSTAQFEEPVGILHYAVKPDPIALDEVTPIELSTEQIQAFFKEEKAEKIAKAADKGKAYPLKEFTCRGAFILEGGEAILITERVMMHYGEKADYTYFKDIVIVCLKGDRILWIKRIPRLQTLAESIAKAAFLGASFGEMRGLNGQNYLLYNEKAVDESLINRTMAWPFGKEQQITVVAFNEKGELQSHALLTKTEVNGYIVPRSMIEVDPNAENEKDAAAQYTIIRNYLLGDRVGLLTLN